MEQAKLLQAWRSGDTRAGQALVKLHYQPVFAFFRRRLDPDTAADLTQATFETLCQKRDDFRGEAAMRTYVFAIARFKLANHRRKAGRAAARWVDVGDDSLPGEEHSLTSIIEDRRERTLVVRALDRLDLDDQILLELKVYEGLSTSRLAAMFRVTGGVISGRVARARGRLRAAIAELEEDHGLADATLRSLAGRLDAIRAQSSS